MTGYEQTLIHVAGGHWHKLDLLEKVVSLLRANDNLCSERTVAPSGKQITNPGLAVACTCIGFTKRATSPVALFLQAFNNSAYIFKNDHIEIEVKAVKALVNNLKPTDLSLILFLNYLVHRSYNSKLHAVVPKLVDVSLKTKAYHILLDTLDMLHGLAGSIKGSPRKQIIGTLQTLNFNHNWALSTQFVEVLFAYNLIEPQSSADEVYASIKEIIKDNPSDEDRYEKANSIFTNQLETPFADAHSKAIDMLTKPEKVKLLTMAAFGSLHGWCVDWILSELIELNDPQSAPVFKKWATNLETDTPTMQDAVAGFDVGVIGYSRFFDEPPVLSSSNNETLAWRIYGEIIFWLHKLEPSEARKRGIPLWKKLRGPYFAASIDPLYQLVNSAHMRHNTDHRSYGKLLDVFPSEIKGLLESYLQERPAPKSAFRFIEETSVITYAIDQLASIGDLKTISILESYAEDKNFGRAAIKAIAAIKNHSS